MLGLVGGAFILVTGLLYLDWARRQALARQEGYGTGHINEPVQLKQEPSVSAALALLPLFSRIREAFVEHSKVAVGERCLRRSTWRSS